MTTPSRLDQFLPYLLSVTSNAVSGRIAQEYRARFGLKIAEWRVMAVLGDAGPMSQRDLTALTVMDKVAVNRACKELEDRHLAARLPNRKDGRSHLLELTEAGWQMHAQIMPLTVQMESRLLANFTPAEVASLKALLRSLKEEARRLGAKAVDRGTPEA